MPADPSSIPVVMPVHPVPAPSAVPIHDRWRQRRRHDKGTRRRPHEWSRLWRRVGERGNEMTRGAGRAGCCAAGAMAFAAALALATGLPARHALAYSAAGDRLFPATLTLPQIAPGDEFYVWSSTLPHNGEL